MNVFNLIGIWFVSFGIILALQGMPLMEKLMRLRTPVLYAAMGATGITFLFMEIRKAGASPATH